MNTLEEAFKYMVSLIETGFEYPDAEWKASSRFSVSAEELAEMYDAR
ncbi:hypothetical protein KFE26_18105 [Shewanella sp. M16]|jgi:hypothetical protein|uniref:Uncharacterized protein n=1 Tax=Shewanella xiamenensis TaxID=332186 RepID=A0ABT6UGU2_9GAMM|nr:MULTISPECIES: hypothetical protein [Shewanella]MBP7662266.1 hypothetical protein [Shewanella sp.]MBS0044200.1 hypothetical protein [Shewanella sp. M16]MDI5833691.1 hypothetical protein [Shewanella xiamenensis]